MQKTVSISRELKATRRRENVAGYLFMAPSLLFFLFDRQTPEQILQTAQAYRQGLPCPTKEFTRGNVFRPVE